MSSGLVENAVSNSVSFIQQSSVSFSDALPVIVPNNPVHVIIDPQVSEYAKLISESVQNKNYLVMFAAILMIVVIMCNKYILPKITSNDHYKVWLPLVTLGLSVGTAFATWGLTPGLNLYEMMISAVIVSVSASGSWELLFKHIFNLIENYKKTTSVSSNTSTVSTTTVTTVSNPVEEEKKP